METLSYVLNVLKVALGLGFVIFIHELGHFLLAKWNGVKVEKFSIGFGSTIFGFRRGETEYVLAAVPLGGFVKMLGEGPDDENSKSSDPRAFPNKSVGARMAIISAGVIMNILLGLACFVYAYGQGGEEMPARIGGVVPGSPAYIAGLQAGDEIMAIDGRGDLSFPSLRVKTQLSGEGQTLHLDVKRPGHEGTLPFELQARREPGVDFPTIGILPMGSLDAGLMSPPAGMVDPPKFPRPETPDERKFRFDTLVSVGPPGEPQTSLKELGEYERLLVRYADKPLVHTFLPRNIADLEASLGEGDRGKFERTMPPTRLTGLGFRLGAGPIASIRKGSPAEKAGFRAGDRILKFNDDPEFDPLKLPYRCTKEAGKPVRFAIERPGTEGQNLFIITATPDDSPCWTQAVAIQDLVDVPGLGFCYPIRARIEGVRPDSPAARAGLKAGDTVATITFPERKPAAPAKAKGQTGSEDETQAGEPREVIKFKPETGPWVNAFWQLQLRPPAPLEVALEGASKPVLVTPEPEPGEFLPYRGLSFRPYFRKLPPQDMAAALRRGWDDTVEGIMSIYAMFRSLAQRRVGPSNMAGPLRLAQIAYQHASFSLTELIRFLGMLSVNLAVVNFLPIPPLDGGQMVFLIAEKVRGKPLPESALITSIYVGLLLVLCLMVFVTYQDVLWLFFKS